MYLHLQYIYAVIDLDRKWRFNIDGVLWSLF